VGACLTMYIQEIIVDGFKSYAQRTVIDGYDFVSEGILAFDPCDVVRRQLTSFCCFVFLDSFYALPSASIRTSTPSRA
jgi:hypothetical protein